MAKQQNMKANMVLKYLRWRNTDARGECAPGYDGEVFDLDPSSSMPEIPLWVFVERGQGGNWSSDMFLSGLGEIVCGLTSAHSREHSSKRACVGDGMRPYGGFD